MECPKCKAAMEAVKIGEVEVDRCTSCKGIWFDGGELTKVMEMKGADTIDSGSAAVGKKENLVGEISCPRCLTPMVQKRDVDQQHIKFETCKTCDGVFLDAGEFRDLNHYTVVDYLRGLFTKTKKK